MASGVRPPKSNGFERDWILKSCIYRAFKGRWGMGLGALGQGLDTIQIHIFILVGID